MRLGDAAFRRIDKVLSFLALFARAASLVGDGYLCLKGRFRAPSHAIHVDDCRRLEEFLGVQDGVQLALIEGPPPRALACAS